VPAGYLFTITSFQGDATMLETLRTLMMCGTLVTLALLVLLAMPQSRLRQFLLPIMGWGFAAFCGVYVISPVDLIPEALVGPLGIFDDVGAIVAGFMAASAAMKAGKEPLQLET
jgi:uncharacterized membrane protein YkvA (DUF1232 family)